MSGRAEAIRRDFDAIARLSGAVADRLGPHEAGLLRRLPGGDTALDVGCGTGAFARRLAARYRAVEGIDPSPEMIAVAREVPCGPGVEFHVASLDDLPAGRTWSCVSALCVLHHLPDVEAATARLARAVAPGGVLLLVDLVERPGLRHLPLNGAAWLASRLAPAAASRPLREAWARHGAGERYPTPEATRRLFERLLPGCEVRHHLRWRSSVLWRAGRDGQDRGGAGGASGGDAREGLRRRPWRT